MIDLAPPGLLDRLIARKALGKTPPSVTKLSHRDTPLLNPSKDRRPFLPRPAKMIPVKQIAMVHDAGIDASAPEPPGKDILAGNDAQIRKLASPRLEGQNQSTGGGEGDIVNCDQVLGKMGKGLISVDALRSEE